MCLKTLILKAARAI